MTAPLAETIELAFANRTAEVSNAVSGGKYQQSSCNTFRDLKKRNGGSNRHLNGEFAKETMLSEMRISG